jgi:hypothetical protein
MRLGTVAIEHRTGVGKILALVSRVGFALPCGVCHLQGTAWNAACAIEQSLLDCLETSLGGSG